MEREKVARFVAARRRNLADSVGDVPVGVAIWKTVVDLSRAALFLGLLAVALVATVYIPIVGIVLLFLLGLVALVAK